MIDYWNSKDFELSKWNGVKYCNKYGAKGNVCLGAECYGYKDCMKNQTNINEESEEN